jgi:hypothetical protein
MDIILENYGGILHRHKYKSVLKSIIFHYEFNILLEHLMKNSVEYVYEETPVFEIYKIWEKNIREKKECRRIIELLSECKCCMEHKKNKPTIIDFDNNKKIDYNPNQSLKYCECSCRHITRACISI